MPSALSSPTKLKTGDMKSTMASGFVFPNVASSESILSKQNSVPGTHRFGSSRPTEIPEVSFYLGLWARIN